MHHPVDKIIQKPFQPKLQQSWQEAPSHSQAVAPENGRPRWQQPRQPLWQALNTLFGLMLPAASLAVLQRFPALTSAVMAQACQGVKSSWPALRSLKSIFATGKQQVCFPCQLLQPTVYLCEDTGQAGLKSTFATEKQQGKKA